MSSGQKSTKPLIVAIREAGFDVEDVAALLRVSHETVLRYARDDSKPVCKFALKGALDTLIQRNPKFYIGTIPMWILYPEFEVYLPSNWSKPQATEGQLTQHQDHQYTPLVLGGAKV